MYKIEFLSRDIKTMLKFYKDAGKVLSSHNNKFFEYFPYLSSTGSKDLPKGFSYTLL